MVHVTQELSREPIRVVRHNGCGRPERHRLVIERRIGQLHHRPAERDFEQRRICCLVRIYRSFQAQQKCQRGRPPPPLDVTERRTFDQRSFRIRGSLHRELRSMPERFDRRRVIRPRLGVREPDQKRIDISGNPRFAAVSGTQRRGAGSRERIEHDIGVWRELLEELIDQSNGIGGGEPEPSVPAVLTILFERQLSALPQRRADCGPCGSQPDDPGKTGASM